MRLIAIASLAAAAAALGACTTVSETPPPVINAPGPTAAALNSTLGPLSFANPRNGNAVDEDFVAISTGIAVSDNGSGYEFASQTMADYSNPGTASFDTATNSLTLNIQQGDISILDTIGPLMLADPGDWTSVQNDLLAGLIAAFPGRFPSASLMDVDFDPAAVAGDIFAADDAIEALNNSSDPASADVIAELTAIAARMAASDFFNYGAAANGLNYSQFKTTGVNSGTTTNYVALGYWDAPAAGGSTADRVFGTTLWGKLTPDGEIPTRGSATYNATILGWVLRQNALEQLRGSFNVDVDFGTGAIAALADTSFVNIDVNGNPVFTDFITLEGTGSLANRNFFDGVLVSVDDPALTGTFEGAFWGPQAAEIGGTFNFTSIDYAGSAAFLGPRN